MKKILTGIALIVPLVVSGAALPLGAVSQASASSLCIVLQQNLSYGMSDTDTTTGKDITVLQNYLHVKGFLSVTPTGYFGNLTKAAVVSFQTAEGISPQSGFVGPLTRAKIQAIECTAQSTATYVNTATTPVSTSNAIGCPAGWTCVQNSTSYVQPVYVTPSYYTPTPSNYAPYSVTPTTSQTTQTTTTQIPSTTSTTLGISSITPFVTGISPGFTSIGSTVTLSGSGFGSNSTVTMSAGTSSLSVLPITASSTALSFIVPSTVIFNSYNVGVTNTNGSTQLISNTVTLGLSSTGTTTLGLASTTVASTTVSSKPVDPCDFGSSLIPGTSSDAVVRLKLFLKIPNGSGSSPALYDAALVTAVKAFQNANNISPDDGAATGMTALLLKTACQNAFF